MRNGIAQHSKKRASLERQYRTVLQEIYEERDHCCAGCGTWSGRITPSHRVPRNRRIDLLTDKRNIDWMCDGCHELVEIGHYDKLDNGEDIVAYIREVDEEYYQIKISKREQNGNTKELRDPDWTPW